MYLLRSLFCNGLCLLLLSASPSDYAQNAAPDDSLFQALGGKEGIGQIVVDFIPIIQHDTRIKKAFNDADIDHLVKMLDEQLCAVSGGPCTYTGKSMKTIHADLAITNAQFNALAEDLQLAMEKRGIPSRTQNKLLAKLAPMQRDIVTR